MLKEIGRLLTAKQIWKLDTDGIRLDFKYNSPFMLHIGTWTGRPWASAEQLNSKQVRKSLNTHLKDTYFFSFNNYNYKHVSICVRIV